MNEKMMHQIIERTMEKVTYPTYQRLQKECLSEFQPLVCEVETEQGKRLLVFTPSFLVYQAISSEVDQEIRQLFLEEKELKNEVEQVFQAIQNYENTHLYDRYLIVSMNDLPIEIGSHMNLVETQDYIYNMMCMYFPKNSVEINQFSSARYETGDYVDAVQSLDLDEYIPITFVPPSPFEQKETTVSYLALHHAYEADSEFFLEGIRGDDAPK